MSLNGLSDSLNNGIKSIGTESMATFGERYDLEVLQDPSVIPSFVWGVQSVFSHKQKQKQKI